MQEINITEELVNEREKDVHKFQESSIFFLSL